MRDWMETAGGGAVVGLLMSLLMAGVLVGLQIAG
jgi:hypothetical protein